MANIKEVVNRINSIISTQQITSAMKVVAAAKLNKVQQQILQMRLYAAQLAAILENVMASTEEQLAKRYIQKRPVEKLLLVVMSSDKGLCGSFNANIFRKVLGYSQDPTHNLAPAQIDILPIGKQALTFFEKRGFRLVKDYLGLSQRLDSGHASQAATFLMNAFFQHNYDQVVLVYNEFKTAATQVAIAKQFLPIVKSKFLPIVKSDKNGSKQEVQIDYLYEPSQTALMEALVPELLKIQFYKALLESNASEHGARLTAMSKATDNAKELLKALRLTYNRSRQAIITREISEIAAGAEALPS